MQEELWRLPAALSHEEQEKTITMIAAALSVETEEARIRLNAFLESTGIYAFSEETARVMALKCHNAVLEDEAMALKVAKNSDFALIYNAMNQIVDERWGETTQQREARERLEKEGQKEPVVLN